MLAADDLGSPGLGRRVLDLLGRRLCRLPRPDADGDDAEHAQDAQAAAHPRGGEEPHRRKH